VWGPKFGQPLTRLHWNYWRAGSADGHGLLRIQSCQPCYQTLDFYNLRTNSHGTRYFRNMREYGRHTGTGYAHWNGSTWVNGR